MVGRHKYGAINEAIICKLSNGALNGCNQVVNVYAVCNVRSLMKLCIITNYDEICNTNKRLLF